MVLGVWAVASPLGRSLPVSWWPWWHLLLGGQCCQTHSWRTILGGLQQWLYFAGSCCRWDVLCWWDSKHRSAGDLS